MAESVVACNVLNQMTELGRPDSIGPCLWVGIVDGQFRVMHQRQAARKAFVSFPEGAQDGILRALTVAAEGQKADIAKPLKGVGAGVFEVVLQYRTDAYRTVYALQLGERLWVVHAFQKKAKQGIKTPTKEIDLIRARLKRLKQEFQP